MRNAALARPHQPDLIASLRWLRSRPAFNAKAFLSLRSVIRYPSGRAVRGSEERYRAAYDEFIAEISEVLLGGRHGYGRPVFIPSHAVFNISRRGCSSILVDLALPNTKPLEEEMHLVCDIWGRSPWSRPDSSIKSMAGSYCLFGAIDMDAQPGA